MPETAVFDIPSKWRSPVAQKYGQVVWMRPALQSLQPAVSAEWRQCDWWAGHGRVRSYAGSGGASALRPVSCLSEVTIAFHARSTMDSCSGFTMLA
jgi:hypothetical protein